MKISVLGSGRWGSCIAWYLDKIGNEVVSCGLKDAPDFLALYYTHKNDYLTFPESIEVTSDLEYAVEELRLLLYQSLPSTCAPICRRLPNIM